MSGQSVYSRASSRGSLSSKATLESNSSGGSTHSNENIRVIVRSRPLNATELSRDEDEIVEVENGDRTLRLSVPSAGGVMAVKKFRFNSVFGSDCSQASFFEQSGVTSLLDSALGGYSATVFAYGQTGSGKTFSMSGIEERLAGGLHGVADESNGLIPRAMSYMFAKTRSQSQQCKYRIKASFAEIYNEQVYDLLNMTNTALQVRWSRDKGFFVDDLFVVECATLQDVMEIVSEGHRNRRVGSHELNKDSSRSHSLLTVHAESEAIDPSDGHVVVRYGKMCFVDLAGSERLKETKSSGVALAETGAINKSLFTLSNVISALSSGGGGGGSGGGGGGGGGNNGDSMAHIPYRDSKLTKLLMDSLGGTSLALMICCVSPSASYADETLNTLKYATRAAKIKNKPVLHLDGKEQLIARLREEIKLLKLENSYLRQKLGHNGPDVETDDGPDDAEETKAVSPTRGRRGLHGHSPSHSHNHNHGHGHSHGHSHAEKARGGYAHQPTLPLIPPGLGLGAPPGQSAGQGPSPPGGMALPGPGGSGRTSPKAAMLVQHQLVRGLDAHFGGHNQVHPGHGGNQGGNDLDNVLAGYQREAQRLKNENRDIRTREVIAERNFHNAMVENESLTKKLEHLEEIFVNDQEPSARAQRVQQMHQANEQMHAKVLELQRALQAQSQRGQGAVQHLQQENAHLKQLVQQLQHREQSMLAAAAIQQPSPYSPAPELQKQPPQYQSYQ